MPSRNQEHARQAQDDVQRRAAGELHLAFRKAGVSVSRMRTNRPTPSQQHARPRNAPPQLRDPPGRALSRNEYPPSRRRRPPESQSAPGSCAGRLARAPPPCTAPNSPPRPKPWIKRSTISSSGARCRSARRWAGGTDQQRAGASSSVSASASRLAAKPVAEMAEHDAPAGVANRVGAEQQQLQSAVGAKLGTSFVEHQRAAVPMIRTIRPSVRVALAHTHGRGGWGIDRFNRAYRVNSTAHADVFFRRRRAQREDTTASLYLSLWERSERGSAPGEGLAAHAMIFTCGAALTHFAAALSQTER